MAGTIDGGKSAAETNRKLYGEDFYKRIGIKGGAAGHGKKGFALNKDRARIAGSIGGKVSRRPPADIEASIKKNKVAYYNLIKRPRKLRSKHADDLFCTYCARFGHMAHECATRTADIARRKRINDKYGVKKTW